VCALVWSVAASLFLVWVVLIQVSGNIVWCEASSGDSNYGELRWSLLPPGHFCSWTTESNGFTATTRPNVLYTVVAVALLVGGVVILAALISNRRRHSGPHARVAPAEFSE
jgi:hypothetical protein